MLASRPRPIELVVYSFSTQEEVFCQRIFPAFETSWEARTGQDLIIEGVYGPSGLLAEQINQGAPADVAVFSNAQHFNWLKLGHRVQQETQPVVLGATPMVIVTRPGNPAGIKDFSDLAQPGLRLLHDEPLRSGAGDWAVLAEYGSAWMETGDRVAAEEQLKSIWRNVRLLGPSARATLTQFELGSGDALVTYEQDARLALERGVALEIIVPPRTVIAQHIAVIVDDNVTKVERPAAQAFIRYLLSDEGQQIFSDFYLWPTGVDQDGLPRSVEHFTVEDLGGWPLAYAELVETLWQTEIEPYLNLEAAPKRLD
jgi:sulfate transport system substrate-binding protein